MKFYFCETCGKRINDGEVRNKGLKGWYCGGCAQGVMTVEMSALNDMQARRMLDKSRATPTAAQPPVQPRPASAGRTAAPDAPVKLKLSIAFLIGAVVIACVIVFAATKGGKTPQTPVAAAATPAPAQTPPQPAPLVTPPDTKPVASAPEAVKPQPPAEPVALQGEAAAERAFDELEKSLKAMSTASNEEKMDVIERYLETYNDSIIASRARLLLANLRTPDPPPVAHVTQPTPAAQGNKAEPRNPDPAPANPGLSAEAIKQDLNQRLKALNPQFEGCDFNVERGKISSIILSNKSVSDISPLKGLQLSYLALHKTQVADLSPLSDMKIWYLGLQQCPLTSLKPLAAMPLNRLDITHTPIDDISMLNVSQLAVLDAGFSRLKDISVLKNAKQLVKLDISRTEVSDLSPIKGAALTYLDIASTKVTDISVLAGMPLESLRMGLTKIEDFSVLKSLPLKAIALTYVANRHQALLKSIPTLKHINAKPAEQFWLDQDSKKK